MNTDEAIGDLIKRYRNNERKLAQARASFASVKAQVSELDRMLGSQANTVRADETEFSAGFGNNVIPRNLLDILASALNELRDAMDEKRRLETCMNQQDLGMFILEKSEVAEPP